MITSPVGALDCCYIWNHLFLTCWFNFATFCVYLKTLSKFLWFMACKIHWTGRCCPPPPPTPETPAPRYLVTNWHQKICQARACAPRGESQKCPSSQPIIHFLWLFKNNTYLKPPSRKHQPKQECMWITLYGRPKIPLDWAVGDPAACNPSIPVQPKSLEPLDPMFTSDWQAGL